MKKYYVKAKQFSNGQFLCGQYEVVVDATSIKEVKSKVKNSNISDVSKIVEISEIKNLKLLQDTPYLEMYKIN